MKRKHFIGPSILYKRPISKTNSSYYSIIPNSTTNKQTICFNFSEEEQLPNNNKYISSVRLNTNANKIKKDSNINTFKNRYSAVKHWIDYIHTPSARGQLIKYIRMQEREARLDEAID